ncbi:MAG: peptidoglycan-binding domain-containing protein [Pararhodobacter sp.]
MRLIGLALMCLLAVSLPAKASGIALVIANERHEHLRDARGAQGLLRLEGALTGAGFSVDLATDLAAPTMRAALSGLREGIERQRHQRVIIVYAGHVLHSGQSAWLLGTDARSPDLATIDDAGLRLETALAVAGQLQGGAVVAIADYGYPGSPASGLAAGLPDQVVVPQGVSLVSGPADQIGAFVRAAARPGTTVRAAAGQGRSLRLQGFNPPYLTFLPEGHAPAAEGDNRAFARADDQGTVEAYRAYLSDFPDGRHADSARAAIAQLENTPERVEDALALSRDERRAIQRELTLLGFDPRGIDGIFGPATRSAVAAWQRHNGYEANGFLNRDQVFELASQAARRAAELEAEARERQAEQERRDRAFWRESGAAGDERGLRLYLERFPEGLFSAVARQRLQEIEEERARAEALRDRTAWDAARALDTVDAYQRYLQDHPQGAFTEQAEERVDLLTGVVEPERPDPQIEAARNQEAALNLPRFTRVMIEQRLALLGYDPGPQDGTFDRETRRAIRAYQRDNGLSETGYMTQGMVARLLAEGIMRLFE